jgi:hypothetical protein
MPARFIASRSAVMPLLDMFPSSGNQYTHGRADGGGAAKFLAKSSATDTVPASAQSAVNMTSIRFFMVFLSLC